MNPLHSSDDQMPNAVKRDWVTCPVCGESDMRREVDEDDNVLILCVNHACASNGGSNHDTIDKPAHNAEIATLRAVLDDIHITAHCLAKAGPLNTPTLEDAWRHYMRIAVKASNALYQTRPHRTP